MKIRDWIDRNRIRLIVRLRKMVMKCFHSGDRLEAKELKASSSSESLATRDFSASGYSSKPGEPDPRLDTSNIEEAESSLRESGFLNYEEARALLGRLEYQKGNVEAALHVFEGIDIPAITPKMKISLSRRSEPSRRHSQSDTAPIMSVHAVSLLFEAILLKSKSLQALGRFREAAESCRIILDTIESALPSGFLDFPSNYKLQEIVNKAVRLLPELWKLALDPKSTVLSYRKALVYHWNLDNTTRMNIEKDFAEFLLYSGCDANPNPPNLRSQMESSYVPKNNLEEAILLLLILLRKMVIGIIEWDPSVCYHLSFALSVGNGLRSLAHQIEEFSDGIIERKERYGTLALCYYAEREEIVALNLLQSLFNNRENHDDFIFERLLASKICVGQSNFLEEGIVYLHQLLRKSEGKCEQKITDVNRLLGILLSAKSRDSNLDSVRISSMQAKALESLEAANQMMKREDAEILFHLSVEYAEQRKLDIALYYAKRLVKIEAGLSIKGWLLLARILSARKKYVEAEAIIDAALDETGKWDQGILLRTKAKLQIAQGRLKIGVETYTRLLAVLQVRNKSFGLHKKNPNIIERGLEMETWHDLANVYTSLSQWRDAEVCLSKSKAIEPHSASRWHATGTNSIVISSPSNMTCL